MTWRHSIIIFLRHEILVIEREGFFLWFEKCYKVFSQASGQPRLVLLLLTTSTLLQISQPAGGFCWVFFPSYLNSYFVAFWRYINKTKHTKPKLFGNHSHETWTIATAATKSLEQVKLQSEENKKILHKIPGLFYPLQKARIWLTAVNYKWHASTQHLATSNPFEMENCTASDLWTERVKEQQLHPEQTWVPVPADLHFPFCHGPVQLKQS